jgi:beta-ureidopropionase
MKRIFFVILLTAFIMTTNVNAEVKPLTEKQLAWHTVKIAAVQMNGNWNWHGDKFKPDSGETVAKYIERAGADGADMVVFPELLLGMFKVPGEATERISALAEKHSIYIAAGCFEIRNDKGHYSNSMLLFGRGGEIVGRYYKMHPAVGSAPFLWPPMPNDPEWMMVDGEELPVFDLDFGRVGFFTCYDGYFPELPRILSLKGAEILIWANARNGSVEDYMTKTFMMQNKVHMVCTNKAIGSGTMIAEWPAGIIAETTEPGEKYICAEVKMDNLRISRKYCREFFQREPEKYADLVKDHHVWKYYQKLPDSDQVPPPEKLDSIEKSTTLPGCVTIEPVINKELKSRTSDRREGEDLYRLSFRITAPWFDGYIELRMPEILHTDMGMHYIDHYISSIMPVSEIRPFPEWKRKPETQTLYYDAVTEEGLAFGAAATPGTDCVELDFYIENNTGRDLDYAAFNPCLNLKGSPDYGQKFNLENLFAVYEGKFQSLAGTTPTPEQAGREPWLVILTKTGENTFEGPKDTKTTWWRVDQIAEANLMAAVSRNRKTLVGYAWDVEDKNLMTNCGNPCLHTGPGPVYDLKNGQHQTWHGKIYLLANDLESLMKQYNVDFN